MDVFNKATTNLGPIGQYAKSIHGYWTFPKLEGEISPRMKFRGKEKLVWSLNNYLGLANHPEVRQTDAEAASKYGLAYPMGARMMSGQSDYHEQLERELAAFVNKEAAYLLNFGYQGMVSIIEAMVDRHDVIVYDSESHACIVDGVRLHFGKRFVFPHNNMESLRKQLERATKITQQTGGGILVITEGVFGMSGDLGKLDKIVEMKKDFNFRLLVDDAHGVGIMGPTGAGTDEHLGVQDGVDIYFGTFAKAFASIGAFVASTKDVIFFLTYNMRSQIFAKSLPMPIVIGGLKRLDLLRKHPEFRTKLWAIANALQKGLKDRGFNLGNTESPVTPVFFSGDPTEAANLAHDLRENYNIFCSVVGYPVVPKGVIIIRIIPTSMHTLQDVEYTLEAFTKIKANLDGGKYKTGKFVNISQS
ncbi:MAG TPA: aminotransferase class I/II-fold pyridoxal phosphate-dependent enzyme [Bacteroidales bacterium]|nr:aminotransferase class I/II-fold pyridoxal phosphate-dependent enzyme [Bacteroidales bacterium]